MKTIIKLTILMILCIQCALAGGSISWDDVKLRIAKSDPELVKMIERSFVVNKPRSVQKAISYQFNSKG